MNIAFTICSASYLPFAKALGDSLVRHNPGYLFKIVLVDDFKADEKFFQPHQVLPIANMKIDSWDEMNSRYTIFELSCALKPFVISYFFQADSSVNQVVYFDSDMLVFGSFSELNKQLEQYAIVVTPHITTPIEDDGLLLNEESIMRSGIYNAGFLAVSRKPETFRFLQWWGTRMKTKCHKDVLNGLFDDQLWLNLVPVLFSDVLVSLDLGYNAAYWNMHERQVQRNGSSYSVNGRVPLVFFHFSGYDLYEPDKISKYQTRYQFEQRPELLPLFKQYMDAVTQNGLIEYSGIKSSYGIAPPQKKSFFKKLFK